MCWEVFLDDASLRKFQAEQQAVQRKRMAREGLPGCVGERKGNDVRLTLITDLNALYLDRCQNCPVIHGLDEAVATAVLTSCSIP